MPESHTFRYNGNVKRAFSLLILTLLFLNACQTRTATPASLLTPYSTRTEVIAAPPVAAPTLQPPPVSIKPTQITHVVKKGEDMGGIATKYGVKTKDLKAANAQVDPYMMPVGTVLIIPSGDPEQDAFRPTVIPTPAVIITTGAPVCYPDPSGGAWCLVQVHNTTGSSVQDISVDFVLRGSDDAEGQTRAAFSLVDRLPNDRFIILSAYFPAPPAQPWQVDTRLRTASPVFSEDERFLVNNLENASTEFSSDKLSVHMSGSIKLQTDQKDAGVIQIAASAYDAMGQPVGLRRWTSPVGLESGSSLVYDFNIYSLGGPIDRVDILPETRP